MFKVDLHTHSIVSPDGGISESEYEEVLEKGKLDFIAITDHNRIDFAEKLHKKSGGKIIVGEEISTQSGEVVGLFLKKRIEPGLSVQKTVEEIHAQGGLVSIPHPFDMLRRGIGELALLDVLSEVDIIEGFNARLILRWQNTKAREFAFKNNIIVSSVSDAHTIHGLGMSYVLVDKSFTRSSAINLLSKARLVKKYQPFLAFFAPKFNRLKKHI